MSRGDFNFTARAAADLSADVGRVMQITGSTGGLPNVIRATSAALGGAKEQLIGILDMNANSTAVGEEVNIALPGAVIENALAGDTITPGTNLELTTDATGRLVPAVAGQQYCALYLSHRTAAVGNRITVKVWHGFTDAAGGSI